MRHRPDATVDSAALRRLCPLRSRQGADAPKADFFNAHLGGAGSYVANLEGADLTYADAAGTIFSEVTSHHAGGGSQVKVVIRTRLDRAPRHRQQRARDPGGVSTCMARGLCAIRCSRMPK